jgi:hypothetical protein
MEAAGIIAADVLPFAISNWGTGGGIGATLSAATPIGYSMAFGVSAGYVVAREYEPVSTTSFAYRPGDQLHVSAALDRTIGTSGKASLSLTWQQFGDDRSAGTNFYQTGDRLNALASYAFIAGARSSGVVYAGWLRREEGSYTTVVQVTPAQDLIYGGAGVRIPLGATVLLPAFDVRVVGHEDGVDQGYTLTAGSGLELPVGTVLLVPSVRARFGNLTIRDGLESGFTGFDAGITVRTGRGGL